MKKYLLEIVVFVCGMAVMIFELVGSRLIAPYFGTSLYVWTSLIGLILGSLSFGYWYGGKIADKKHDLKTFSAILIFSGLSIALITIIKEPVFLFIQKNISNVKFGSLISSLLLFSIPSTLLGMVSPYAAKLKLHSLDVSGRTVGNLYAISTLGSILGTFLAGFFLIPFFGSTKLLILISLTLLILSSLVFLDHWLKTKLIAGALLLTLLLATPSINKYFESSGIFTFESLYNFITIYSSHDPKTNEPIRVLKINNEYSSAMFAGSDDLVFDYTKYYRLAKHFAPSAQKTLLLGGAGYSYPKDFLKQFPSSTIDVVEIDPKLTELAKTYFKLPTSTRLNIFHEDARVFVNQTKNKYDVIFGDAFQSFHSLPFQLTTKEAVQKYADLLNSNGVVLVNIISGIEGKKGEFLRSEMATFKKVFPQVYIFPVTNPGEGDKIQNIMLVALKDKAPVSFKSSDAELQSYLSHLWKNNIPNDIPVLTDDYAPVDYYINKMLAS